MTSSHMRRSTLFRTAHLLAYPLRIERARALRVIDRTECQRFVDFAVKLREPIRLVSRVGKKQAAWSACV